MTDAVWGSQRKPKMFNIWPFAVIHQSFQKLRDPLGLPQYTTLGAGQGQTTRDLPFRVRAQMGAGSTVLEGDI